MELIRRLQRVLRRRLGFKEVWTLGEVTSSRNTAKFGRTMNFISSILTDHDKRFIRGGRASSNVGIVIGGK